MIEPDYVEVRAGASHQIEKEHSMSHSVVVYRSRQEEMMDTWLWDEGGAGVIAVIMLVCGVIVVLAEKFENWKMRRRQRHRYGHHR